MQFNAWNGECMADLFEKIGISRTPLPEKTVTRKMIDEAEKALGTMFSNEYIEYLEKYGEAAIDGHELTGLCSPDRVNVVSVTKLERMGRASSTTFMYVVEQTGIDDIVIWQDKSGKVYLTIGDKKPEFIACSISEYLDRY